MTIVMMAKGARNASPSSTKGTAATKVWIFGNLYSRFSAERAAAVGMVIPTNPRTVTTPKKTETIYLFIEEQKPRKKGRKEGGKTNEEEAKEAKRSKKG